MSYIFTKGATSQSIELYIIDSTNGTPELGVLWNTAGIDLKYRRKDAVVVSITEAALTTPLLTDTWETGGFLEIGNGVYRLDLPDAALASAAGIDRVVVFGTVTGMVVLPVTIHLTAFDLSTASAAQTADNDTKLGTIETNIGSPANIDSGGATIAGNLKKMADDNAGATFDATTDSLNKIRDDRTLPAADYVVVGDTLARVTLTDTVTTYTGNTKQTGNNFTRLGAPAGASVSADIAAVKAETASIQTETTAIDVLTKAAGDGDLAAIKVILDALTAAGAAKLALGATTMITGIVSWDNTNATTTVIYSSDITEATADHFNGRLFVPTSGALLGQYTDITDYALDTGEGKFTVTALTEAPADNTTFVII